MCRRKGSVEAEEEVILDLNKVRQDACACGNWVRPSVSNQPTNPRRAPILHYLHRTQLAKGHGYLDVGDWNPSPGEHRHLGYSVDTTGYEVGPVRGRGVSVGMDVLGVV